MSSKMFWVVAACVCQIVALVGASIALMEWRVVQTGADVSGWLTGVLLLVVFPLAGCLFCVAMLAKPLQRTRRFGPTCSPASPPGGRRS